MTFIRLGQIRQQEILEQAARCRDETPIWGRLWVWSAALWQKRRQPAPQAIMPACEICAENG